MSKTELAVINETLTPAIVFSTENGVPDILAAIKSEVAKFEPDMSTTAGRKEIASMAYKVSRSKTALDEMGKNLTADARLQIEAVNKGRKEITEALDKLRDEVREPLTKWENSEKDRVAALEAALEQMKGFGNSGPTLFSVEVQIKIDGLEEFYSACDWQEFSNRARAAYEEIKEHLKGVLANREQQEKERAELEQLRKEKEEREKKEHDDRIAKEAAEKARLEAEEKAAKEKAEAEAKVQAEAQAKIDAAEEAKAQAEADKKKAEENRIAAEKKAEVEKAQAEEEKRQAAIDAEHQAAQARKDERIKMEAEKEKLAEEERKREQNRTHRAKINREMLAGFVAAGLSERAGKAAIKAMVNGDVPHVSVKY